MDRKLERRLVRHLLGELPPEEARAVEELARRDPAVRRELERLTAAWRDLDHPTPAAPDDFAARVVGRLGGAPATSGSLPVALRWAAPAVGVLGVVAGVALGRWASTDEPLDLAAGQPSMAQSYLALLDDAAAEEGGER